MTPHEAFSRKALLKTIKAITTAMGDEYADDALDTLVQDCFAEQASEVNNNGRPAQIECLLKNAWTPEDILGRLRINKEEEQEEDD